MLTLERALVDRQRLDGAGGAGVVAVAAVDADVGVAAGRQRRVVAELGTVPLAFSVTV